MNIEQRLQQIKDDVAKKMGWTCYAWAVNNCSYAELFKINDRAALRLAKEMCDLQITECAKKVEGQIFDDGTFRQVVFIDNILSAKNVCNQQQ